MQHEIKAAPKFLIAQPWEDQDEHATTSGGIIIPSKEIPTTAWAKVQSVGEEAVDHFVVGDLVLIRRRDAMPFSADGVELLAILHDQVLATKRADPIANLAAYLAANPSLRKD